jgi:hypothetical protein
MRTQNRVHFQHLLWSKWPFLAICRSASGPVDCVAAPNTNGIDAEELVSLRRSVLTISGEMSDDLSVGQMSAELVEITYLQNSGWT